MGRRIVGLLILVLLAFGVGVYVTHRYMSTQSTYTMSIAASGAPVKLSVDPSPIKDPGAIADAAARVDPSVVTIDTLYRPQLAYSYGDAYSIGPAPRDMPLGTGSGVILTSDGTIVTNNHVVQNATKINVTLSDGHQLQGKVLGADPESDLAVVKVDANNLPAATLGDSDKLRVGEWVVAVGDPLRVGTTVTAGIISAIRKNNSGIGAGASLNSAIQTDAPINPGNSGGALADIEGRVIGINTAILSPTGSSIGIGFAIPINIVRKVVPELISEGKIARPWLGISFGTLTDDIRNQFDQNLDIQIPPDVQGVVVGDVASDSPADQAGIRQGDIIRRVNGKQITSAEDMQQIIKTAKVGDTLTLDIWRGGEEAQVQATLQQRPATAPTP